ncbi:MAG: alkaline phosphatase family protein, partial [Bacteroidota bacterium]
MRRSCVRLFFFIIIVSSAGFARQKPKLIVLISIDQGRADYLDRFDKQFTGGLKRLHSEGIVFTNADLNYASTETGPGHATLSTGSYPATNGILANDWHDPKTKKQVYCVSDSNAHSVEGEGGGSSPRNLVVTAIGDWLKAESATSKVVSVSSKDRAAILMGGKQPNQVFWYDRKTGHLVT